jgi:hypothetical protein
MACGVARLLVARRRCETAKLNHPNKRRDLIDPVHRLAPPFVTLHDQKFLFRKSSVAVRMAAYGICTHRAGT